MPPNSILLTFHIFFCYLSLPTPLMIVMLLATPAIRNSIQIPKMYRNLVNLTSSTSTLLQVGFRGPNSSIVGHVIMRSKQLHFGLAAVNDKNDIINGDRCLSNVGAQDDLSHAIRDVAKDKSLIFAWQLGVQRNNPERHLIIS